MKTSANPPQISKPDETTKRVRSRGGLYLAAGFLFLILGGLAAAMPGDYWPIFLISFAFSLVGLFVARGLPRRIIAVALTGLSGGLFLQDFLIFMAE